MRFSCFIRSTARLKLRRAEDHHLIAAQVAGGKRRQTGADRGVEAGRKLGPAHQAGQGAQGGVDQRLAQVVGQQQAAASDNFPAAGDGPQQVGHRLGPAALLCPHHGAGGVQPGAVEQQQVVVEGRLAPRLAEVFEPLGLQQQAITLQQDGEFLFQPPHRPALLPEEIPDILLGILRKEKGEGLPVFPEVGTAFVLPGEKEVTEFPLLEVRVQQAAHGLAGCGRSRIHGGRFGKGPEQVEAVVHFPAGRPQYRGHSRLRCPPGFEQVEGKKESQQQW